MLTSLSPLHLERLLMLKHSMHLLATHHDPGVCKFTLELAVKAAADCVRNKSLETEKPS